jgi:hypothetical protein
VSSYYHKFGINDVFYNRLKAHPQNEFFIWDSKVFYNDKTVQPGAFAANVTNVDVGHVSLYEMNVDRSSDDTGFISPYIVKTSNKIKFNNMSDAEFNLLDPGARITRKRVFFFWLECARCYTDTGWAHNKARWGLFWLRAKKYFQPLSKE